MSFDIPHACNVPNDCDIFGVGSIVDEFENTLGLFDDGQPGSYFDDFRFRLFSEDEDDASPNDLEASANLND